MPLPFKKEKKLEEKSNNHQALFYANAAVQLSVIFAFQQFGVTWIVYILVAVISILIAVQTLGAAAVFAQIVPEKTETKKIEGINFLISLLYMVSCYHVYLIGLVGFAWIGAAHSVIHLLTNILGAIKK